VVRIIIFISLLLIINITCKQDNAGAAAEIPSQHIGFQYWMTKNLDTPLEGSFCYDDNANNCLKYGRLYTWQAALNACPSGWKLPSDIDWFDLTDATGGIINSGKRLKVYGDTGFDALLGGKRNGRGHYEDIDEVGYYWTSTELDALNAWSRRFYADSTVVLSNESNKK